MSVRWLAERLDDGVLAARVGRDGDRLIAEWPGSARLSVNRDGSDIVFESLPDARENVVEKLRTGVVPLLLAHMRGAIPLHASAVSLGGRAVAFVGASGHGKSTLAATLCDMHGASLLGDDGVVIERSGDHFDVVALGECHWLDADAARALGRPDDFGKDKVPLEPLRTDVARAPLAMIAHLGFLDRKTPRLVPVLGLDAVTGLLAQLTRFVIDDPEVARHDLAALADLVDRTRIFRLERPRRLDLLGATAALVAAKMAESS